MLHDFIYKKFNDSQNQLMTKEIRKVFDMTVPGGLDTAQAGLGHPYSRCISWAGSDTPELCSHRDRVI